MSEIPILQDKSYPEGFPLFHDFNRLVEGELSEQEVTDLSHKIKSDPGITLQYLMFMQVVSEISFPHCPLQFHDLNQDTKKFLDILEESQWEQAPAKNTKHLVIGVCSSLLAGFICVGLLLNSLLTPAAVVCHLKPLEAVQCEHVHTKLWGLISFNASDVNVGISEGRAFDRVNLQKGILALRFTSGAIVNIAAPATFEFRQGQTLFLHAGKMIVDVDKDLRSVSIGTPQGWIKHVGTEFCVDVSEDSGCEIQVIEGSVVVAPSLEGTLQAENLCLLEARQAGVISKKSEQIKAISYNPDKFDHLLETVSGVAKHTSNVKIVREPQQMILRGGACESNNYIFLICEKFNVTPPEDFTFTELAAGPRHVLQESIGFESGKTIHGNNSTYDVYLFHRDLVGTPLVPKPNEVAACEFDLEIECTFDRPIVGFIENGQQLQLTDALFENTGCIYPDPMVDEVKFRDIGSDSVLMLSADKRTLRMQLPNISKTGIKKHIDHLRVLVESEVKLSN